MHQKIELRNSQQLSLTPAIQQSLRILQCSTLDLQTEIALALAENPILESIDDNQITDYETSANVAANQLLHQEIYTSSRSTDNDEEYSPPDVAIEQTLRDYLLSQLHETYATQRDCILVEALIDTLDDNGYLQESFEEILSFFELEDLVTLDELQFALRLLQSFDPPGIAARNLSECLLLQLKRLKHQLDPQVYKCVLKICETELTTLANVDIKTLQKLTQSSEQTIREVYQFISTLNPKPGRAWNAPVADYAVVDVFVRFINGKWQVALNPAVIPQVRINPEYEGWLKSIDKKDIGLLADQYAQAKTFVKSIHHRFETVLDVARCIVSMQQGFLEKGFAQLNPLVLRDIADILGIHESTVSRAITQKFIDTPHGVFELKRFFSTALQTDSGDSVSAAAIQDHIRRLIEQEPAAKPLSDAKICEHLAQLGITLARRTAAKYREQMGIEVASLRKNRSILKS